MDLLQELKEVQFWMDQIGTDNLPNLQGNFFNKAKNKLMEIIVDGERRAWDKAHREGGQL